MLRGLWRRRKGWIVGTAVVVAIGVLAYVLFGNGMAFGGQPKTINVTNKPIGQGATVTGTKVPRTIHADLAKGATPPPFTDAKTRKPAKPASPILEIGPSGTMAASATITLPLNRVATSNDVVLVATNLSHRPDGWQLIKSTVTADKQHVQFTTDHLSWWQPLWFSLQGALGELKDQFLDGMTSGVFKQAKKPKCENEDRAREDLYAINSDNKNTIYWCFGKEKGERVLKVVNEKDYPLEIKQKGLKFKSSSGENLFDLSRLASIGHTIISAGQEVDFTVSLPKKGGKATLDTDLSATALGLKAVDVLANAVVTLALHTNLGSATSAVKLVNELLYNKGCLGVLGTFNMGDLIKECFDEDFLKSNFGWQSALLAPVMLAFSVIDLGKAVLGVYNDHKNGTAKYHVEITRTTRAAILKSFVGKWYVHGTWIDISSNGSATKWWNDGPCYDIIANPDAPAIQCGGNARVRFNVNSDGTITGQITSVWYTTEDGDDAPGDYQPTGEYKVGDTFMVSHQSDGHLLWVTYLGRLAPTNTDGRNRNLCDDYAIKRNDGQYQECGA